MSDDEEVTEEVLARLSHDLAEHVRASLREGDEGGAVVDSGGGETNEDAPAPTTSAVSWSSREAPDDDDIMISALVSAMAKGREMMANPSSCTDPVRVTVNLDKDIELPAEDAVDSLSNEERDNVVGQVYQRLMEIESRLLLDAKALPDAVSVAPRRFVTALVAACSSCR